MPYNTRPGNPRQYQRHNAEIKGGYSIYGIKTPMHLYPPWALATWVGSVWYDHQDTIAVTHPEDTFTDMIGWNIEAFLVWCAAKGHTHRPIPKHNVVPEHLL